MHDHELKHYFDTLGLKPGAHPDEIENAYRELIEYWNPDRVPDFYRHKAMEGRDKVENAYQELMGLLNKNQLPINRPAPEKPAPVKPEQPSAEAERVFLGKGQDGTSFYLDKKSIVFGKDKAEVMIDIYPPEGSARLHKAQGYTRRAGFEALECLAEKWGIGLASGVFIRYDMYYKSTCGHLIQEEMETRKVWKPIAPGTMEETAWKVVERILHEEKVA